MRRKPNRKPAKIPRPKSLKRRATRLMVSRNPITLPIEKTSSGKELDFNRTGFCAGYATRVAESVFGLKYAKGAAWELAGLPGNRLVIRFARRAGKDFERPWLRPSSIENSLQPGRLVGIFLPFSEVQHEHPERLYTHVALYLGKYNNRHWVMHNVAGPRIDSLETVIDPNSEFKGIIVDIIEPEK